MTDKEKNIIINHRIQKSKETIEEAEVLLKNKKLRAALNRIDYAIFYITSALALKHNFSTSKHSQLLGWFNKTFIKTGELPVNLSAIYKRAFDKRQKGDYEDMMTFVKAEVEEHFKDMLYFVSEIEKFINQN